MVISYQSLFASEGAPEVSAALRPRHAAHTGILSNLRSLRDRYRRHCGPLRACLRVREAAGPRVPQLLNHLPLLSTRVTCLTKLTLGMIPRGLVEWDAASAVIVADHFAAVPAVMSAEEEGELLVADCAVRGELVWFPMPDCWRACDVAEGLCEVLTCCSAETTVELFGIGFFVWVVGWEANV